MQTNTCIIQMHIYVLHNFKHNTNAHICITQMQTYAISKCIHTRRRMQKLLKHTVALVFAVYQLN